MYTRERQIIHRDIKPHNLKLTADGQIALLDFGLAKTDSDTSAVSSTSVFGFTRRYSPPEQMQDQGTSPQSDIYALGTTLYHLLTGVKPLDALVRTAAIAKSEPDPLHTAKEVHAAVGPEISAMLLKSMELNPARRFKDANEFRQALKRLGRENMRALHNWSEPGSIDGADRPNVNVTLVKQSSVDPFESYSILKPAEMEWLIPKPSRRPFVVIALIGLTHPDSRTEQTQKANLRVRKTVKYPIDSVWNEASCPHSCGGRYCFPRSASTCREIAESCHGQLSEEIHFEPGLGASPTLLPGGCGDAS